MTLILGILVVEDVSARDLSGSALAKIPAHVLEMSIRAGESELILLLDDTAIAESAHLKKTQSGLQFNNQETLKVRSRAYADLRSAVLKGFDQDEFELLYGYETLPMMFIRVATPAALYKLLENDHVIRVFENSVHTLSLMQSLPMIGQLESAAGGHRGDGTSVAVLDTGVDYKRDAFGSCVSPGVPDDCKVVFAADFANDDGELDINGHGTNVAGIVLGVAPETSILALDVFTGMGIYTADVIAAIDWVITNQAAYNIVAMNLSFGTDFFEYVCHESWATTPFAIARAAGVVPIVASGNDGKIDGVKNPACAPGAVRVGAVHDARPPDSGYRACGTKLVDADVVPCFSNSASFLDLLAPGVDISAAELTKSGTSMATPHVAGAYAVLKGGSAYPEDSIDATIERLKNTGNPVLDDRNGITFPRINLEAALFGLLPDQVPEIRSFHPALAAEGEELQILGDGFRGVDQVFVGDTAAFEFTVNSSQMITVNVGPGSSGDIRVATSVGSDSLPGFIFLNSVREIEPNNNLARANPVMISGERLAGGLSDHDDVDFFRFGFDAGPVSFGIKPVRSLCCARYVQFILQDSKGNVLASKQVDEESDIPLVMNANIEQRGSYYLSVSETPEEDPVFDGDYQITVPESIYPNTNPEFITVAPDVAFMGQAYTYAIFADDVDGDAVYMSLLAGPAGMVLDPVTQTIYWQPGEDQAGFSDVELLLFDDFGGSSIQKFGIAVIDSSRLDVSATDGTFKNHVRVSFNLIDGATAYRVFRCAGNTGDCGPPVGFAKDGLFKDMKAVPGVMYYYRIRACNKAKCSDISSADPGFASIAPEKPTGIRATDGTFHDRVRVTFDPVEAAVIYRVFRCLDRGQTCGSPIGFPGNTSFDDKQGGPGIVYFYRVKACNLQHCSKFSVANTGHSSVEASAAPKAPIEEGPRPIPVLGAEARWLLTLMVLGYGLAFKYRECRASKLDWF